jgi:hypothetical protein
MEIEAVLIDTPKLVYSIPTSDIPPLVKWNGVIQDPRVYVWNPADDYEGNGEIATLTFRHRIVPTGEVTVCYGDGRLIA